MDIGQKQKQYRVLILGWWGSTSRNLYRYQQIHEKLGAELVVSVPCSSGAMMGKGKDGHEAISKATEVFQNEQNSRVVVHLFSNGGLFIYLRLFKENPELRAKVGAVIFDSTPGYLNFITMAGAIFANNPQLRKLRKVTYGTMVLSSVSLLMMLRKWPRQGLQLGLLLVLLGGIASLHSRQFNKKYHDEVIGDPMCAPSLYIYSKADQLVDYRVVERVIKGRSMHKPMVTCFEDSAHVAHGKKYPEDYTAAVYQLIKLVLQS